jgi:hypothetical protein
MVMCHYPDEKNLKDLLDDLLEYYMEVHSLKELSDYNKETVHLLSSHEMKPERERSVCRAFLRCAGIPFTEESIIASRDEPPDVLFDLARFEVLEVLDEDRRRGDELKKKVESVEKAKSYDDVSLPPPSLKPMTLAELIPLITDKLKNKFENYSRRCISCSTIDILVYVNKHETYLVPASLGVIEEQFDTESLDIQGWRSVSVLMSFSKTIIDNQGWLSPAIPVTDSQLENLDMQPSMAPLN